MGLVFGPCNKSLRSPHRTATHRTAARNASKRKRTAPYKPPPPAPHCLASPPKRRSGSQGSLPHSLRSAGHQFLGGDCASEMRRWTSLLPNLESSYRMFSDVAMSQCDGVPETFSEVLSTSAFTFSFAYSITEAFVRFVFAFLPSLAHIHHALDGAAVHVAGACFAVWELVTQRHFRCERAVRPQCRAVQAGLCVRWALHSFHSALPFPLPFKGCAAVL